MKKASTLFAAFRQVWLDLSRLPDPTVDLLETGNVSVDACVSWGFSSSGHAAKRSLSDCCLFTLPVRILNCGGGDGPDAFNVYHLGPTQACDIAYCSAPVEPNQSQRERGSESDILRAAFSFPFCLSTLQVKYIRSTYKFHTHHVNKFGQKHAVQRALKRAYKGQTCSGVLHKKCTMRGTHV